jgi:transposase
MGRALSDDLRVRVAEADERGEGSCRVLAKRFGVSWEYVRKVRQQRKQHKSLARRPQSRFGVPSRLSDSVKASLLSLVAAQPDITIEELRERIATELSLSVSWSTMRRWVLKLGLRLKKSRSMPRSETPKPTESSANSSLSASG